MNRSSTDPRSSRSLCRLRQEGTASATTQFGVLRLASYTYFYQGGYLQAIDCRVML